MFSIVITEKGGAQRQLDLDLPEIGVGRLEDNHVCLPKTNVSKYHARLVLKDHRYVLIDQRSTNGTFVNGRRITGPTVLRRGDKIYIGDFILTLNSTASGARPVAARDFSPLPARTPSSEPPRPESPAPTAAPSIPPTAPGLASELRRTKPERRVSAEPRSGPTIQSTHLSSSLPPPLPRPSPPPPPLPRSVTSSPPASPDSDLPPRAKAPQPAASETAESSPPAPISGPVRTERISGIPPAAVSKIPPLPLPRIAPVPERAESVDSAQAAALSGLTSPAALAPSVRLQGALGVLMERLAGHMDVASSQESAFPSEQQPALEQLLDELTDEGTLGPEIDRHYLREAAISEAVGLGPLDRLLANRAVREIVVDGPTRVLADLGGGLTPVAAFFSGETAVLSVARRLLRRAGQELLSDEPIQEAQLPGGGSFQLLLPPLSPKGPLISVRCPMRAQNSPEDFVADGVLSQEMVALLRGALQQRKNILVFGPSGAGVSHLLAMLTRLLPEHERIVTIEHSPRASLLNPQVLPLSRKALPEASLAELLRRAAFLRYDRLVLDDLYPEELWSALFVAAGSGGVLLGTHAPNPAVALSLIEFGARSGQNGRAVPAQLMAAALQFLVHVGPDASGTRRVLSIGELRITPAETLELRTHFRHDGKAFVASFLGR